MDGIWNVLRFLEVATCDACKREKEEVQEVRKPDGRVLRLCPLDYKKQIRLEAKAQSVERSGETLIDNGVNRDSFAGQGR